LTLLRNLVEQFVNASHAATQTTNAINFDSPDLVLGVIALERKNGSFGDIPREAAGVTWNAFDEARARVHEYALAANEFMKTMNTQTNSDRHRTLVGASQATDMFLTSFEALQESMEPQCPYYNGVKIHRVFH